MTDPQPINAWKKFAIRAFFGGAGFAVALAILMGAAMWYHNRPERPKPWNTAALTATFDTMEIWAGHWKDTLSYSVGFYYNVQNNTDRNFEVSNSALTKMAVLSDGNVLSKEFGNYEDGDVIVEGPLFIPPGGTARIALYVGYYYPTDFTKADQADRDKLIATFNNRLKELNGFVLFDEQNHYRVDLPEGWKQMEGVKGDAPPQPKLPKHQD